MNWLFDLGNTRLKWVAADASDDAPVHALAHHQAVDPCIGLDAALAAIQPGDTAWLASVTATTVNTSVENALRDRGARVIKAHTLAEFAGVRIAYATPSQLGVDRFLSLVAAHALAGGPWLIVNVGTALTLDLLAVDGRHHGGLIAPSPDLMRQALAQRAPQLPPTGGAIHDFASSTIDALASGSTLAARGLIERSLGAAERLLGAAPRLLLAGGGADALAAGWSMQSLCQPDLVLRGLRLWMQAQQSSSPPR